MFRNYAMPGSKCLPVGGTSDGRTAERPLDSFKEWLFAAYSAILGPAAERSAVRPFGRTANG